MLSHLLLPLVVFVLAWFCLFKATHYWFMWPGDAMLSAMLCAILFFVITVFSVALYDRTTTSDAIVHGDGAMTYTVRTYYDSELGVQKRIVSVVVPTE
jgi:hypothetical protein